MSNDLAIVDTSAVESDIAHYCAEQMKDAEHLAKQVLRVVIRDDDDLERCAEYMRDIQSALAEIQAERDSRVKPLHSAYKAAHDKFKPLIDSVRNSLKVLKDEYGKYTKAKRDEAAKLLAEAAVSDDPGEVRKAVKVATPDNEGVSERIAWKWMLGGEDPKVDGAELHAQIPQCIYILLTSGYMIPDKERIDREVAAQGDSHPLVKKGAIKAYKESIISVRRKNED